MTAEKSSKTDKVAAAVEEIEKAAAKGSPKKKAPAKRAAKPKTATAEKAAAKPAKKKTAAKKPAAAKKETVGKEPEATEKKAAAPKKKPAKKKQKKQLKITQVKSKIGFDGRQRKVLKGLGLGRIGKEVVRVDDPCIRGMVAKVSHLVTVEEVEA